MHLCAYSNYSLWNLQQNETSSYKDWKIQQVLVMSWQRVISEEQMCWQLLGQHFGTSKVSRAPWWSVSTVWLSNAKASWDTGNHTQFSKAKGRVQRSTAQSQAVWVLCEVNVHIHIMYRHHDHLHGWVSGFQKVLDSKDIFCLVRLSCVPAQCLFMKYKYSLVWLSSWETREYWKMGTEDGSQSWLGMKW